MNDEVITLLSEIDFLSRLNEKLINPDGHQFKRLFAVSAPLSAVLISEMNSRTARLINIVIEDERKPQELSGFSNC